MADETPQDAPEVEGDVQTNASTLSHLIAGYLEDRDDIAEANVVTVDGESGAVTSRVVSQGGTVFTVTVVPGDAVEG